MIEATVRVGEEQTSRSREEKKMDRFENKGREGKEALKQDDELHSSSGG